MKYKGINNEFFQVERIIEANCKILKESGSSELSLLWFTSDNNHLIIDSESHVFHRNNIIFITEFHKIEIKKINELQLLRFNRPFYCIIDHDSEVGCKGILYYGASTLPLIHISGKEREIFEAIWKILYMELETKDNLQLEMLQAMLKRTLILSTRIYKKQSGFKIKNVRDADIIREFNFLVEKHFKEKHSVVDYAALLHKSPKTLSNLFNKLGSKSPLQFIQDRILLESRRLLTHTQKSISEIAYDLGFNDVQSFSRFFKNKEGVSPLEYRKSKKPISLNLTK
jgi:AraC-like DNA-binding protein